MKKAGSPFLSFIAYGDEANFVHPPRPKDPKVPWEQQWTVKARFKSTASLLLGEGAEGSERGSRRTERAPQRDAPPREASEAQKPQEPDPLKEGVNILRGIFGR